MLYKLKETNEAIKDVTELATYMIDRFKNQKAASDFVDRYDSEATQLCNFPYGYRGLSFEYRGYEIRVKPFDTYNLFFIVDSFEKTIVILRVLKDRQDWQTILSWHNEYHL